jgi:hypothetical protein
MGKGNLGLPLGASADDDRHAAFQAQIYADEQRPRFDVRQFLC